MHPISSRDENDSLSSIEEVSQLFTSTSSGALSIYSKIVGGDALTQKKAGFSCSGLNPGSYFISQDEGMTKSPVENLEKAIVLLLF